jgi:hypothetical protein
MERKAIWKLTDSYLKTGQGTAAADERRGGQHHNEAGGGQEVGRRGSLRERVKDLLKSVLHSRSLPCLVRVSHLRAPVSQECPKSTNSLPFRSSQAGTRRWIAAFLHP